METIIIAIVFLLVFMIGYFYYGIGANVDEKFCNIKDEYQTHALLAPNIPVDPQTEFKIGGKYNKPIVDGNLAPVEGKFIFPIWDYLYDGIWKSDEKINGTTETQKWRINKEGCGPIIGEYAANKFLHLPKKPFMDGAIDTDIYFPDWNLLEMKDKNGYNFDACNNGKNDGYKRGIQYWPPF